MDLSPELKYYLNFGHPFFMWVLFAFTLYVMYLGVQVRRTRSAEGEAKKALIQGKFNDKHYQMGSILLGMVVMGNMGGMAVTYLNNSKLFFGAHLLAGLGMTCPLCAFCNLGSLYEKRRRLGSQCSYCLELSDRWYFWLAGHHRDANCRQNFGQCA